MRGTQAKALRKQKQPKTVGPAMEIRIQVFAPDGRVEVKGFPDNFMQAMDIIQTGARRVAAYFVNMAREGKVDEKLNLEKSRIIEPSFVPPKGLGVN